MNFSTTSEEQHRLMTESPMIPLLVKMSIPTMLSQLITVLYNTVDTWFVSKIGTEATAAVGVVFSVMSIIQAFGFGIAMGTGSLISISLGEKKDDDAAMYAASGMVFSVSVGLIVEIFGLLFSSSLLKLLGATDSILPFAKDYAFFIFLCAPVMCASFVISNILRCEGNSFEAMIGLCVGGIINIVLDPILIFACNLGTKGAAIATAVSQVISLIVLFVLFIKGKGVLKLNIRQFSKSSHTYIKIISTGLPTICRQSLGSLSTALLNRKAGVYGDSAIAAVTVATKIYVLMRNLVIGLGQGFQPVAGYNYGAGIINRTKKAFEYATIAATVVCIIFSALIFFNSQSIIGWFRDDTQVISAGSEMLSYFCIALPFLSYGTFVNQLYQCLGFKFEATLLASCRQGIFFVPLIFILTRFLGLRGVEMVQSVSDICTFVVSIPFQVHFYKKINRTE